MTHADAYVEVAERALVAAEAALSKAIQEKAAFLGYHAFESTGGAFCVSRSVPYPRGHGAKINVFKNAARLETFSRTVAELALVVIALRNECLYPTALGSGIVSRPSLVITEAQTKRLLGRIRSLVQKVKQTV